LTLNALFAFGQKEADNWFFGDYAAINFKTGSPQVLTGSVMTTDEGCTSISDSAGNLLFYTDGSYIWNKNHQIMMNGSGLKGNLSSTQSAIVVKKPNSYNLYYVFTLDAFVGSNGFQYSIIDINKQSGLGEVVTKNVFLTNGLSEKISVARSCDNNSYWIVVHEYNSNKFLSYQLDKNGLNSTPVTTSIGSNHNHGHPTKSDCSGYMKISPNGKKIACAIGYTNKVEIFDFDNLTGKITNGITIDNINQPYGLEFSPNSNLLYVTEIILNTVLQYDISIYNTNAIKLSKLTIGSLVGTYGGPLQMANNGKMYAGSRVSSSISCINNPNIKGNGCSFIANALNLGSGKCRFGFPNILPNYFSTKSTNNKLIIKEGCLNKSTSFSFTDSSIVSNATWYFGDKKNSTSTKYTTVFTYKDTGTYKIKLIYSHSTCTKDSLFYSIKISDILPLKLGNDTSFCDLMNFKLKSNVNATKYQWNNSLTDTFNSYQPKKFGKHSLKITTNCGVFSDTINLDSIGTIQTFSLGNDTILCSNVLNQLIAPSYFKNFIWSTGDTTPMTKVNNSGQYWLKGSNKCGEASDTIMIQLVNPLKFKLGKDTTICFNTNFQIKGPPLMKNYNWNTGETTQNIIPIHEGLYKLMTKDNNNCLSKDSIFIFDKSIKGSLNLGKDTIYCEDFSKKLEVNPNFKPIKWNTGDTTTSILVTQPKTYSVSAFNGCYWLSDSITIKQEKPKSLNLGKDTSVCFARPHILYAPQGFIKYNWNNGSQNSSIEVKNPGIYWCKALSNNQCESIDSIKFGRDASDITYLIPNAFSPNVDAVNEYFPFQKQEPNTVIKIYNRWGELIYENEEGISWNGQYKNQDCSQDIYLYLFEYKNCNRTKRTLSGTFTLLR